MKPLQNFGDLLKAAHARIRSGAPPREPLRTTQEMANELGITRWCRRRPLPDRAVTPFERFCEMVAGLLPYSDGKPSLRLYSTLVRQFHDTVPNPTHEERNRAMALIARASGMSQ